MGGQDRDTGEPRFPGEWWLSPEVEVSPSPIAGLGLFARCDLAARTVVERLGSRAIGAAELAALTPPYSSLTVSEGRHLLAQPPRTRSATATTRARRTSGISTPPRSRCARTRRRAPS